MSEITENHTITNVGKGMVKAIMQSNPITNFVHTIYDEYASRQWQQRREKWEEVFEEKLKNIKDDINLNKINKIDNFAQILSQAVQGAMSDIDENKVDLYANTVINAIKYEDTNNIKKHIFLNMLRDFSLLHIKLLKCFSKSLNSGDFNGGFQTRIRDKSPNVMDIILEQNPDIKEHKELLHIITHDLYNRRLLENEYPLQMLLSFGEIDKQTTALGDEFLAFILEHEKNKIK